MKSLFAIQRDNRMTSRDYGSMCDWAVFHEGDLIAMFVHEDDAREFVSNCEYIEGSGGYQIAQAKP